jgi:hypothetical protein
LETIRYLPRPEFGIDINLMASGHAGLGYLQQILLHPSKWDKFEEAKCELCPWHKNLP